MSTDSLGQCSERIRPDEEEIATGLLLGHVATPFPPAGAPEAPLLALESAIRPFLERPPCVIAFSGGRDSVALLCVGAALARRECVPLPIPVTLRFASPATHEQRWQERVIATLSLDDWLRIPIGDELDLVGPIAQRSLRAHGVLYPANVHTIVPLAECARGGAVLTGVGGDDVFGNWPWADLARLLSKQRRARAGDARRIVHALAPRAVRADVLRRRQPLLLPWLLEPWKSETASRIASELVAAPRTWAARMCWSASWRPWRGTVSNMQLLAHDLGVAVGAPFLDPRFLGALAAAGGRWGWGDRTQTMRAVFANLVPEWMLDRRAKAEFSEVFFGAHTKRFARAWDGHGLDPAVFDPSVLRNVWDSRQPHFLSASALQAAWSGSVGADSSLGRTATSSASR